MTSTDTLNQFVNEALKLGRTRDEIQFALESAGWSAREISDALMAYAETDFTPPVPRPRNQLTARDTFIYLILFTALGFSSGYLIALIHSILSIALPATTDNAYVHRNATDLIRLASAVLVIAGPVYLWMTVYTRRQIAKDIGHKRSLVRKWLTYLAMFVAAMFFLGDAVFVIYTFLDGETSIRFLLKALNIAVINSAIFVFYLRDVEEIKEDG